MVEQSALSKLDATIEQRLSDPQNRYTDDLLADRNKRLKKVGEESAEFVVACVDGDKLAIAEEAADLFYHVLVAARAQGVALSDIDQVLAGRAN